MSGGISGRQNEWVNTWDEMWLMWEWKDLIMWPYGASKKYRRGEKRVVKEKKTEWEFDMWQEWMNGDRKHSERKRKWKGGRRDTEGMRKRDSKIGVLEEKRGRSHKWEESVTKKK